MLASRMPPKVGLGVPWVYSWGVPGKVGSGCPWVYPGCALDAPYGGSGHVPWVYPVCPPRWVWVFSCAFDRMMQEVWVAPTLVQ